MKNESRQSLSSNTDADVSRRAAEWFALLLDDSATANDRADFRMWLECDPRNARAYAELEHLWIGAAMVPNAAEISRMSRRKLLKGGGAAAVVLSVGLGGAAYLRPIDADYRTATGETAIITLPDGSTVELSTASAISLDFTASERAIILHEGEAFFSVAKDMSRPFIVRSKSLRSEALGTQFSVAILENGIAIAVVEHVVRVSSSSQSEEVGEGQSILFENDRLSRPIETDIASRLSWRDGKLVFISTPFADVVSALSRWRRGKIIVMDAALARRPVSVIVDVRRAGTLLDGLQHGLPIRVDTYSPWLALIYPR